MAVDIDLQRRIQNLSDEALIEMLKKASDYRGEAISYVQNELSRRGRLDAVNASIASTRQQQEQEKARRNFTVRILNETLGIEEKLTRMVSVAGTSFFREASLSITPEKIDLSCTDDRGSTHALGGILQEDIKQIRLKKSVFTPGQQLIKPVMTGAFSGIVMAVILFLRIGDRRVIGPAETVGVGILLVMFMTAIFIVVNLNKIVWSHLAVVIFDSADGKSIEVSIENEKADALIALFADRKIPIESL